MVINRFSCSFVSSKVFKKTISFSFAFQVCISSIYAQRNPRSYFIDEFWPIWRKLLYQFYLAWNKTVEIMKEVCKFGPKNLRKNFRLKNFYRHEMFLVNSRCRKSLVMPPKSYNFMQLFWAFVDVPVRPKHVPGVYMNTSLNLFRVNSGIFFLVSFFIVLLAKRSKWRKCFAKLCSYENSCFRLIFCLVVINLNIKVLGNYWVPYQQIFFLSTPWLILTVYWLI